MLQRGLVVCSRVVGDVQVAHFQHMRHESECASSCEVLEMITVPERTTYSRDIPKTCQLDPTTDLDGTHSIVNNTTIIVSSPNNALVLFGSV